MSGPFQPIRLLPSCRINVALQWRMFHELTQRTWSVAIPVGSALYEVDSGSGRAAKGSAPRSVVPVRRDARRRNELPQAGVEQ